METVDFRALNIPEQASVLDLGCGEGRHTIAARWHSAAHPIVGVDLDPSAVATAAGKALDYPNPDAAHPCHFMVANGAQLPFADHSFSHVICCEVLEHLVDYDSVLSEIMRVLAPGGTLVISVPRAWPERLCWWLSQDYHAVAGGHVRIFHAQRLRQEIENLGLHHRHRHWAHALHAPYWWLRCATWRRGETFFAVRWYHKLLVWDLMKRPRITRMVEACLNPVMGKSVVMYFDKPRAAQGAAHRSQLCHQDNAKQGQKFEPSH